MVVSCVVVVILMYQHPPVLRVFRCFFLMYLKAFKRHRSEGLGSLINKLNYYNPDLDLTSRVFFL